MAIGIAWNVLADMNWEMSIDKMMKYLEKQKSKYQGEYECYCQQGRYGLATKFKNVVELIEEMEKYIKEEENGKD